MRWVCDFFILFFLRFAWQCIDLYFKEMRVNQATCSGSCILPPLLPFDLPFFNLLGAWSPSHVHRSSVLASAQGGPRARWETGLEPGMEAWADCARSLHMLLYPLMSHFSIADKKSAKGRVRESWCSKWSVFLLVSTKQSHEWPPPLAFCLAVLSPFLNLRQLPAGSTL